MESSETPRKPDASPANKGTFQICGKVGSVVHDPEKAPPNRVCYRCASEYGMQDTDDE